MSTSRSIFVNLPVEDLNRSVNFFTKLGFTFNPKYTDENATCMIISDTIYVMLLKKEFFKTFIKKAITDSTKSTEVILALQVESRSKVDDMVNIALASGGKVSNNKSDMGWMYSWSFQDPDDHLWEVLYMEPDAA